MRRSKPSEISFRLVTRADLPLLRGWLVQSHVKRWWPDADEAIAEITEHLNDPLVDCFVMRLGDRDMGYLQSYDPHHWPDHPFADARAGSRGLDMFIGEAELIGQGHGSRATRQFVDGLFAAGVPEARIDPHPDNVAAIKAYEKSGFVAYGERQTEWGLVLLMRRINGNRAT